jgi:RNA polymerase sigma-70 factor (ECF subfamily)
MQLSATSELERAIRPDVAALAGDFEALVRLYRPKVFRFALASLRDVDAAETVTQDCFLRAYQARERFRQDRVASIWTAAEKLPEKQRTVFLLRFVEDMDLLEIAVATGMKEGTVKTHLFRALRAVRERIGETS